ncbi:hypothetical protein REPUB_Repub01dG0072100 [Reevesia pubescens]
MGSVPGELTADTPQDDIEKLSSKLRKAPAWMPQNPSHSMVPCHLKCRFGSGLFCLVQSIAFPLRSNYSGRTDKIDFKSWDMQLDKHLSRAWSRDRDISTVTKKEECEIDFAKLDIRQVIAHGTFGTVYHGIYDSKMLEVLDWGWMGLPQLRKLLLFRHHSVKRLSFGISLTTKMLQRRTANSHEKGEGKGGKKREKGSRRAEGLGGEKSREQIADAEALLDITNTLVTFVKEPNGDGISAADFVILLLPPFIS